MVFPQLKFQLDVKSTKRAILDGKLCLMVSSLLSTFAPLIVVRFDVLMCFLWTGFRKTDEALLKESAAGFTTVLFLA